VIQATLTGESMPVEKTEARDARPNVSQIEHTNICFFGHERGKRFGAWR
jgi:magnesium-transporting ATPase (P-type)